MRNLRLMRSISSKISKPSRNISSTLVVGLLASLLMAISPPANAASCVVTTNYTSTTAAATTVLTFFNTGASCSWTPPTGVSSINILVVGGGGGGGGSNSKCIKTFDCPTGSVQDFNGGGGGGGVVNATSTSINPNYALTLSVGSGGARGAASSALANDENMTMATSGAAGGQSRVCVDLLTSPSSCTATTYLAAGGGGGLMPWNRHTGMLISNLSGDGGASGSFIGGSNSWAGAGGGAGAGANGGNAAASTGANEGANRAAGNGGAGVSSSITNTATNYGGGGGGGAGCNGVLFGSGGAGGGGAGGNGAGISGTNRLGGGGGGADSCSAPQNGGTGGTGVIIISYTTPSSVATLSALTTTAGALNTAFAAATTAYTVSVANAVTGVTVTPTRTQANATIQVRVNSGTYATVTSGAASVNQALNVGSNPIEITVTAQDGTLKTYTITVTRAGAVAASTPTGLAYTATSLKTISASWNTASGASSYLLTLYASVANGAGTLASISISGLSRDITISDYAPLADGTSYQISIKSVGDAISYTDSAESTKLAVTTLADSTAPVSSGAITATVTTGTSVSVSYSATDNSSLASIITYYSTSASLTSPMNCGSTSLSGTSASGTITCTVPATDATYYVYTQATDTAGNVDAAPGSADDSIIRDATAPVSSGAITATVTTGTSVSVSYSATDNSSLASIITYYSTSASLTSPVNCGSASLSGTSASGTITCTIPASDAMYYMYSQATDTAGNVEAAPGSADDSIIRDVAAPSAPASLALSNSTNSASTSDLITSYTALVFTGTAEASAIVQLYVGGVATGNTCIATAGSFSCTTGTLPSGDNVITALATDAASNTSTASSSVTVTVDTTAPTQTISAIQISADTGSSATDFTTATAAQSINATLSAVLGSGESLWGSIDAGSNYTDISASVSTTAITWSATLSGSSSINFQARDSAGNVGSNATQAYVLDTTTPTQTISGIHISADTGSSSTDFITTTAAQSITGTLSAVLGSGESLWGSVDAGSNYTDISASVSITAITWSATLSGTSSIKFQVRDTAGNVGATATQAYLLDTAAPVISGASSSLVTDTSSSIAFNSGENGTYYYLVRVYSISVSAPIGNTIIGQGTASVNIAKATSAVVALVDNVSALSGLTAGISYKAYVVVQDAAGNISSVTEIAFTTKSVQATLIITSVNGIVGTELLLTASGGSGDGSISFTLSPGSECSLLSSTLSATGAVTCLVTVTKEADSTYILATSSPTTVTFLVYIVTSGSGNTCPDNASSGTTISLNSCQSVSTPTLVAPKITSISTPNGYVGDAVIITGTNLSGTTVVKFGGVIATISSVATTTVVVVVPVGAKTGRVVLSTPGGTSIGPVFTVNT
jgi:hypothetical protein